MANGAADPDHFLPGYRAGLVFDTPRRPCVGRWGQIADECERRGVAIRNASPGTALDFFATCDIESGLHWLDEALDAN
jgi:hypothetical protein